MNRIDPDSIHDRVEYIRYMFDNADKHPTAYELFVLPIAAYDSDGKLVKADKKFRSFTGITEEDIRSGRANIFDCLNKENKGIVSAAKKAFHDEEVIVHDLVCPLRPATEGVRPEICRYRDAVFFPMAYDREYVPYCGVLLIDEETADSG